MLAEQFTCFKDKYVKLTETIKGFQGICDGKYDDIPEQAFYMQGTIEEVMAKAEETKKAQLSRVFWVRRIAHFFWKSRHRSG